MIKRIFYAFILFCLLGTGLNGQVVYGENSLPYPSTFYQEVDEKVDPLLQRNLEMVINSNRKWKKLVANRKMAVGLVDLREMHNLKYASINGNHMLYAASLPKIAVLLAAMEAIKEECLVYDDKLKKDLRLMIAKSNNAATTRVIEAIGFDKIEETMTRNKYQLYNISEGGGLWVGKKYAKAGRRNPDPLKGLSHAATVDQVSRFYTMLAYGKLVDEQWNKEMMKYLVDPELNHKFVKTLNKIAPFADIYRKSGSWRQYHADSALVFGKNNRRYILVALIEDQSGGSICTSLVKKAEEVLAMSNRPVKINPSGEIVKPVVTGE